MGIGPSEPDREEFDALERSLQTNFREVAEALYRADVLLFCTGAGFSADSGLALYKDIADVEAYREQGLCYRSICRSDWLSKDPSLFYGFWGTCFNDYRTTEPHEGYSIVRQWRDESFAYSSIANEIRRQLEHMHTGGKQEKEKEKEEPPTEQDKEHDYIQPYSVHGHAGAFFCFTSNVDAHSFDHFDPCEVRECHGNVEIWQCGHEQGPCSNRLWRAPKMFGFDIDTQTMRTRWSVPSPTNSSSSEAEIRAHNGSDGPVLHQNCSNVMESVKKDENGHVIWSDHIAKAGRVNKPFGRRKQLLARLPKNLSRDTAKSFHTGSYPRCPDCNSLARPAVMMFDDLSFVDDTAQEDRWQSWCKAVRNVAKSWTRQGSRYLRVMILEIGCGAEVPTVRGVSENTAVRFAEDCEVTFVRINPAYPLPDIPFPYIFPNIRRFSLPCRGLYAVHHISKYYSEFLAKRSEQMAAAAPCFNTRGAQRRLAGLQRVPAGLRGASRSRSRSRSPDRSPITPSHPQMALLMLSLKKHSNYKTLKRIAEAARSEEDLSQDLLIARKIYMMTWGEDPADTDDSFLLPSDRAQEEASQLTGLRVGSPVSEKRLSETELAEAPMDAEAPVLATRDDLPNLSSAAASSTQQCPSVDATLATPAPPEEKHDAPDEKIAAPEEKHDTSADPVDAQSEEQHATEEPPAMLGVYALRSRAVVRTHPKRPVAR